MRAAMHAGVDRVAMWLQDRATREAAPYRPCPPRPLDCDGPLAAIPFAPAAPGRWSAPSPRPLRAGDRMSLQVFASRAPFAGTIVLVPPWKIGSPSLVRRYTALLARAGYEVWLLVPPEHMGRAAAGTPSGHGFATPDIARFRAVFEQLVVEIRTAIGMAARRGTAGVVGLSLGALAAAFAIGSTEEPELAALIAPPVRLASVLVETPIGRRYRRLALRAGSTWPEPPELARTMAPFDPCTRERPACRLFVAAGCHDRIAFESHAVQLAERWGVEPHVYARGHVTLLFRCRPLLRDLRSFVSTGRHVRRAR